MTTDRYFKERRGTKVTKTRVAVTLDKISRDAVRTMTTKNLKHAIASDEAALESGTIRRSK